MKTTDKSIKLKDFECELNICENNISVIITGYKGEGEHVIIPGYIQNLPVKEIGDVAFECNDKIKKITIEEGITCIRLGAFENCTELTDVELSDGLCKIESYAFMGCKKLAKIRFPKSILIIDKFAFDDCEELTSVFIPKEALEAGAFHNCGKLKEINVDDENPEFSQ
jgi:hypothetical protein